MKKILFSLTALCACSGAATAQTNVTVFGAIDMSVRTTRNQGGGAVTGIGDQGNSASKIGFRGQEDLGGGIKAAFHLEAGVLPDTGESLGQKFGIGLFNRQATVSLLGNFGEIRLGRDWTATYANLWNYEPSYNFGVASTLHLSHNLGQPSYAWTNNAISYSLPGGLGGFHGQLSYAPGEGAADGRYAGGRVGYISGPLDISVSAGSQSVAGGNFKTANAGASYNFQVVKLMAFFNQEKLINAKESRAVASAIVPVGSDYVFASYGVSSVSNSPGADGASQFGAGYVHNLSGRTALYTNVAWLNNRGAGRLSTNDFGVSAPAPRAGGDSRSIEAGLRHFF